MLVVQVLRLLLLMEWLLRLNCWDLLTMLLMMLVMLLACLLVVYLSSP